MGFRHGFLILWVLVTLGWFCKAQAPRGFWPRETMQNNQQDDFWQSRPHPVMFHPRAAPHAVTPPALQMPDQAPRDATGTPNPVTAAPNLVTPAPKQKSNNVPLSWKFPVIQSMPASQPAYVGSRRLTPANSVAVKCGENAVQIEVKQDFFGTGLKVDPSSITLSGCAFTEYDTSAGVMVFQAALQDCNSVKVLSEEALVYIFSVVYKPPSMPGIPVVRSRGATVGVECHYIRRQNVSSSALQPQWKPYSSTQAAEDLLVFSLKLMSDDWKTESTSNVFFLGESINIEASVVQHNHVALRVFVDNCVAAADQSMKEDPRYTVIENHGCFTDGRVSNSSFLPRLQDDKLQFQLEAFQFQQDTGSVYLACLLKATSASAVLDEEHKTCSFSDNSWLSAERNDQMCMCCNTVCGKRKVRHLGKGQGLQWEGRVVIGPLFVKEREAEPWTG